MLSPNVSSWRVADDRSTVPCGLEPGGHSRGSEVSIPSRKRRDASHATSRPVAAAFGTTDARGGVGGGDPLSNAPAVGVLVQDRRIGGGSLAQDEGARTAAISERGSGAGVDRGGWEWPVQDGRRDQGVDRERVWGELHARKRVQPACEAGMLSESASRTP